MNDSDDSLLELLKKTYSHMEINRIRINEKFENISQLWLRDCPYYAEFMFRFNFFETRQIDTFGVNCLDGRLNLYYNPEYLYGGLEYYEFDKNGKPIPLIDEKGEVLYNEKGKVKYKTTIWPGLSERYQVRDNKKELIQSEIEAILLHEIMHLVLLTQERALDDTKMWNIASDMIINDMIKDMKINGRPLPLPVGGVYLQDAIDKGYAGEAITEPLYYWLIEKRNEWSNSKDCPDCHGKGKKPCSTCGGTGKNKKGQPCPDCDGEGEIECPTCQGTGNNSDELFDKIFDSKIDTHEMLFDCDNLTESVLSDIARLAEKKGFGLLKGVGLEKLKKLFARSQVNWKSLLRKSLSRYVHGSGNKQEPTWNRFNRRGLVAPGKHNLDMQIVIACDDSGSISMKEIEQFFAEIEKIVRDVGKITLLFWDTKIQSVDTYKKGKWRDIEIKGRGGTSVQCVFDWVKENKKKSPVVILTDGAFSYDFDTFDLTTIWCVTVNSNNPPKGKVIHINIR